MRTVSLQDGTNITAIGLGTWSMGGDSRADPRQDEKALRALREAFRLGYTHIDTAEMYASGHTEELVGKALKEVERDRIIITTKVKPENLRYNSVLRSLDGSLKRLGVDWIDIYLIHWPSRSIPLEDTFRALNQAVMEGKVRHLGVSNFDLTLLKEAQGLAETPIVTNQVPYSLVTRRYVQNEVIPYCQENGIVVTAYSPVESGRMKRIPALERAAEAHGASIYQVALAWLVNQPGVITIPMSQDPRHLRENLEAGEIVLSEEEKTALNNCC